MPKPSLSEITIATRKIVKAARNNDHASSLTPRMIRREIEETLGLEEGTLSEKEYKEAVSKAAVKATNSDDDFSGQETSDETDGDTVSTPKDKLKQKSDQLDVIKTVKKPQRKITAKKPTINSVESKRKSRKDTKVYKSASIIATSDEEDEGMTNSKVAREMISAPVSKKRKVADDDDVISSQELKSKSKSKSGKHGDDEKHSRSKQGLAASSSKLSDNSDSEFETSILIEAPPVKKKAKKDVNVAPQSMSTQTFSLTRQSTTKTEPKSRASKKAGSELSKGEETIKRLKSFVNACGVRKVWKKEFENIEEKPSQQIKRLKEILAELGMDGRLSMEKAKKIKAERELAKELEDVLDFEKSVTEQTSRGRTKAKPSKTKKMNSDDDGSGSILSDFPPVKHKNMARKAIMAFLDDSDED